MNYLNLVVFGMVLYGVYFFGVKILSKHLHPIVVLFTVCAITMPIVGLYMFYERVQIEVNWFLLFSCVLGVMAGISFVLLYKALSIGPISVVAPIWALYVLIPMILGIFLLKEPVTLKKLLGIVFACLSIVLLTQ